MQEKRTTRHSNGQFRRRNFRFAAAIFFALFPLSQNFTKAAEPPKAELLVSPKVCAGQAGQPCDMELEVTWSAPSAMDLCLRLRDSGETLECWQQAREGRYTMPFASETSVGLQLVDAALCVLDEFEIKVVSRELRDTRRRRRHVWSIL